MGEELSRQAYGTTTETLLHPVVLLSILIAGIFIFLLRSKYLIVPLLIVSIFVPLSQRIVIAGLDFMVLRIIILISWIRILMGPERVSIKLNTIDKVLILYVLSNIIGYTLLWQTSGAFINRLGFAYSVFGIYFLCRVLIKDVADIERILKTLAVISIFVAICMTIEQINGRNIFSIFGGVPENTPIRGGRLRSQGAFAHSILAGMFGATLLPLIVSLWWKERRNTAIVFIGVISATVIVITSSSSGPVLTYFAGVVALSMWSFRRHMRMIRWGTLLLIICLHIAMKAPVWALIGRTGVLTGSSGYHRYRMVDQFIRRADEWWLYGTKSTDHWGWMMWDTVNQYVSVGTTSGLLSLILFIALIALCFRSVGRAIQAIKNSSDEQKRLWAFGAALFAHVIGFFGICYFDQTILLWYLLLAMISMISCLSDDNVCVKEQSSP